MATLAAGGDMLAAQREFRVGVVIEGDIAPGLGRVAAFAFHAAQPFMLVLLLVAFDALRGRRLVALAGMTALAADFCVGPRQRKLRLLMIVGDLPPALLGVAALAVVTRLAAMRTILAVTVLARLSSFPEWLTSGVAALAAGRRMAADEGEVGRGMIEHFAIEAHDIGIAPFMVGVTMSASVGGDLLALAVKAAA